MNEWALWRIVEESGISPEVIRHEWTRIDVIKYNAVLDMRQSYDIARDQYQSKDD